MQAAAVEHLHGDAEALAFLAEAVFERHFDVVEIDVANMGALLAHLLFGLADGDAFEIARHEEGADAGAALLVGIGARHDGEERGAVGVGDVALGAVEHVVIAGALGFGAHGGGVRARFRFGQRKRCDDLAAGDAGQPFLLLRVGAEHHQALAADADIGAEGGAEGRRAAAELEHHAAFGFHRKPEAAVFFRDGKTEETERLHFRERVGGDGVVFGDFRFKRDQPFVDEAANGGEQRVEFGGLHQQI